jgi:hypothetical protein
MNSGRRVGPYGGAVVYEGLIRSSAGTPKGTPQALPGFSPDGVASAATWDATDHLADEGVRARVPRSAPIQRVEVPPGVTVQENTSVVESTRWQPRSARSVREEPETNTGPKRRANGETAWPAGELASDSEALHGSRSGSWPSARWEWMAA